MADGQEDGAEEGEEEEEGVPGSPSPSASSSFPTIVDIRPDEDGNLRIMVKVN